MNPIKAIDLALVGFLDRHSTRDAVGAAKTLTACSMVALAAQILLSVPVREVVFGVLLVAILVVDVRAAGRGTYYTWTSTFAALVRLLAVAATLGLGLSFVMSGDSLTGVYFMFTVFYVMAMYLLDVHAKRSGAAR